MLGFAVEDTGMDVPTTDATVVLTGIHKRYPMFRRRLDRLRALAGRVGGLPVKVALRDVSLLARAGEAVGIIGENGSGKSTLLRIVAGISEASEGSVRVAPPVAAILELGLGFHPEFSGRDNALLYGALIGVGEDVMQERLDELLAFAELGEFVDQPVRTYSSGMVARLAFAVATHVDPRVLVVDEALAVGDGAFQRKCVERMVRFKEEGRTVLFCSHAMYLVAGFCERALWLRDGAVAAAGPAAEVIHAYEDYLRHRGKRELEAPPPAAEGTLARITAVQIEPAKHVATGDTVTVTARLTRACPGLPVHIGVFFEDQHGVCLLAAATRWDELPPLRARDEQTVVLQFERFPIRRGELDLTVVVADESTLQVIDQVVVRHALAVDATRWEPGLIDSPHRWEFR
ncbi:MAG TPA: ABC transporter ATP-binding protein [Thermoanaerobaculaceae bacterium]|nr:ABC transporter ATP-binding protein [Thermoanaerobaculaceae bacterium]